MKDLVLRLSNAGLSIYSDEQLHEHMRHELVTAMHEGRFSDAFPEPFMHEISTFMKSAIADGHNRVAISLLTAEKGLATFVYTIDVTSTGLSHGAATDWYVPRRSSDRVMPPEFQDIPRIAIDVSNP